MTSYQVCKFDAAPSKAWIKPSNGQARSICVYPVLFQNGFRQVYTTGSTNPPVVGQFSVGCFDLAQDGAVVNFAVDSSNAMYIIPSGLKNNFEQCLISAPAPEVCSSYHSYGQWR
jgi:hypothetical protein